MTPDSRPSSPEPYCTGGCHDGDMPDFDHYVDSINATGAEVPAAFGAWLALTSEWDGKMQQKGSSDE